MTLDEFFRALEALIDERDSDDDPGQGNFSCEDCRACNNCRFCVGCDSCEDCTYCEECIECEGGTQSKRCVGCERVSYCEDSRDCKASRYLTLCVGCTNSVHCLACVGLDGAEFYVLNQKRTRKQYFAVLREVQALMEARREGGWRPPGIGLASEIFDARAAGRDHQLGSAPWLDEGAERGRYPDRGGREPASAGAAEDPWHYRPEPEPEPRRPPPPPPEARAPSRYPSPGPSPGYFEAGYEAGYEDRHDARYEDRYDDPDPRGRKPRPSDVPPRGASGREPSGYRVLGSRRESSDHRGPSGPSYPESPGAPRRREPSRHQGGEPRGFPRGREQTGYEPPREPSGYRPLEVDDDLVLDDPRDVRPRGREPSWSSRPNRPAPPPRPLDGSRPLDGPRHLDGPGEDSDWVEAEDTRRFDFVRDRPRRTGGRGDADTDAPVSVRRHGSRERTVPHEPGDRGRLGVDVPRPGTPDPQERDWDDAPAWEDPPGAAQPKRRKRSLRRAGRPERKAQGDGRRDVTNTGSYRTGSAPKKKD